MFISQTRSELDDSTMILTISFRYIFLADFEGVELNGPNNLKTDSNDSIYIFFYSNSKRVELNRIN